MGLAIHFLFWYPGRWPGLSGCGPLGLGMNGGRVTGTKKTYRGLTPTAKQCCRCAAEKSPVGAAMMFGLCCDSVGCANSFTLGPLARLRKVPLGLR